MRTTRSANRQALPELPETFLNELQRLVDPSTVEHLQIATSFTPDRTVDGQSIKWYLHNIGPHVALRVTKYRCSAPLAGDSTARGAKKRKVVKGPTRFFLIVEGPETFSHGFNHGLLIAPEQSDNHSFRPRYQQTPDLWTTRGFHATAGAEIRMMVERSSVSQSVANGDNVAPNSDVNADNGSTPRASLLNISASASPEQQGVVPAVCPGASALRNPRVDTITTRIQIALHPPADNHAADDIDWPHSPVINSAKLSTDGEAVYEMYDWALIPHLGKRIILEFMDETGGIMRRVRLAEVSTLKSIFLNAAAVYRKAPGTLQVALNAKEWDGDLIAGNVVEYQRFLNGIKALECWKEGLEARCRVGIKQGFRYEDLIED